MTKSIAQQMAEINVEGVTIGEVTGGAKKQKYWTPDGREVWAVPSMRGYVIRKNGKQTSSGIRDANLDQGWLLHTERN